VRTRADWRAWLVPAAAILVLNTSLTFGNVWPTPGIYWRAALSIELAAVLAIVLVTQAWSRSAATGGLRWLAGLWVVLVAGHYIDVTVFGLYGRNVNLYWDARHLSNVSAMLAGSTSSWVLAAVLAVTLLGVLAAWATARWALRQVADAAGRSATRLALGVLVAAIVASFSIDRALRDPADTDDRDDLFAAPVSPVLARQARLLLDTAGLVTTVRLAASPTLDASLSGLGRSDVVLAFVESYGAVTYDRPDIAAALAASRSALEAALRDTHRGVVSVYVRSPTFGGASWLAHLSLLSGVEVTDGYAHALLMTQPRDTIVGTFGRAGYRTVAVMPGLRQPWPEGAFYGFDRIIGFDDLAWTGPRFGWWTIPDQFTLARLDALERRPGARAPVFAFLPTGTSHAPFGPVPPYQPDWTRVLSSDPFATADVERALADTPNLRDLTPHYARAIAYEFETLAGYVLETAGQDLVLIVIGDHQPPAAVSGPGARWEVPLHIMTSRPSVLNGLRARGFNDGLTPSGLAVGGMAELLPILLEAFSEPNGTPRPLE
jgi:hypothetical protein